MKTLTKKLSEKNKVFIPYIMAGDHKDGLNGLEETIKFLTDLGVSAIEIGVPFSDPVADGPVIELAGLRSLAHGTSLSKIIDKLKNIETDTPLVIMSYFNPIYQYGIENFFESLKGTSVKGVIIPDLPYEHEDFVSKYVDTSDIAFVRLVSLSTDKTRQKQLVKDAEGFIYAVSINGVTGSKNSYEDSLDKHLADLKALSPIPVVTGFGVSTLDDVKRFDKVSDGVIVGSYIVEKLYEGDREEVADFISKAVDVK